MINSIYDRADHIGGIEGVTFDNGACVAMIMLAKDTVLWTASDANDVEIAEGTATDRKAAIAAAKAIVAA